MCNDVKDGQLHFATMYEYQLQYIAFIEASSKHYYQNVRKLIITVQCSQLMKKRYKKTFKRVENEYFVARRRNKECTKCMSKVGAVYINTGERMAGSPSGGNHKS